MLSANNELIPIDNQNQEQAPSSPLRNLLSRLLRSPSGMIGSFLVVLHLLIALTSPFIVPYSPVEFDTKAIRKPPSETHLFGTDELGRDVFTRTLLGGRIALQVTLISTIVAITWGGLLGIIVGYVGGLLDNIVMRLVDAILALPDLLILLLVVSLFGSSNSILVMALSFLSGLGVIRIARAATLGIVGQEFILAAYALGARKHEIVRRHLLPNILDILLVEGTLRWSWMLLSFSSLTFLGFGITPPTPDWGLMIADGRDVLAIAPWITFFPIVAISSLIIGANLLVGALSKAIGNH